MKQTTIYSLGIHNGLESRSDIFDHGTQCIPDKDVVHIYNGMLLRHKKE